MSFDSDTPADLVFDDDLIESILYGLGPARPTEATIFAPARKLLEEISSIRDADDFCAVLDECTEFLAHDNRLTFVLFEAIQDLALEAVMSGSETVAAEGEALRRRLMDAVANFEG